MGLVRVQLTAKNVCSRTVSRIKLTYWLMVTKEINRHQSEASMLVYEADMLRLTESSEQSMLDFFSESQPFK